MRAVKGLVEGKAVRRNSGLDVAQQAAALYQLEHIDLAALQEPERLWQQQRPMMIAWLCTSCVALVLFAPFFLSSALFLGAQAAAILGICASCMHLFRGSRTTGGCDIAEYAMCHAQFAHANRMWHICGSSQGSGDEVRLSLQQDAWHPHLQWPWPPHVAAPGCCDSCKGAVVACCSSCMTTRQCNMCTDQPRLIIEETESMVNSRDTNCHLYPYSIRGTGLSHVLPAPAP